jgi:hypothetical protein
MDRVALKTLTNTYWCVTGWVPKDKRKTDPEAFAKAKAAGIMFDACAVTHDELVKRGRAAFGKITRESVVEAFLASLTTRRLELRAALGSWVYLKNLPGHSHTGSGMCDICGQYNSPDEEQGLNVLNFERFKWGGVRHDNLLFAVFDLETFPELDSLKPCHEDISLFEGIIREIQRVPSETTAANLQKFIPKELKSNKDERESLLDILGVCGVLQTAEHNGYLHKFVKYSDRVLPPQRYVDRMYPFCWWRGSDGVNVSALDELFGGEMIGVSNLRT